MSHNCIAWQWTLSTKSYILHFVVVSCFFASRVNRPLIISHTRESPLPCQKYVRDWVLLRSDTKDSFRYLPTFPSNLSEVEKSKIWRRFLSAVAFDLSSFAMEQHIWNLKQSWLAYISSDIWYGLEYVPEGA